VDFSHATVLGMPLGSVYWLFPFISHTLRRHLAVRMC